MKIILPLFLETDDHVLCYLHFEDQIFVSIITLIYSVSVVLIRRVIAPPSSPVLYTHGSDCVQSKQFRPKFETEIFFVRLNWSVEKGVQMSWFQNLWLLDFNFDISFRRQLKMLYEHFDKWNSSGVMRDFLFSSLNISLIVQQKSNKTDLFYEDWSDFPFDIILTI